jgi:hypothetical protein
MQPSAATNIGSLGCQLALQIAIRICHGNGTRSINMVFSAEDSVKLTVADAKEVLCKPPHNICKLGASHVVLVLNGGLLKDSTALADLAMTTGRIVTAVIISKPSLSVLEFDQLRVRSPERLPSAVVSNTDASFDAGADIFGSQICASSASIASPLILPECSEVHQPSSASVTQGPDCEDEFATSRSAAAASPNLPESFEDAYSIPEFCVDRQELDKLKLLDWVQIERFYLNCVAEDGSFDFHDLPASASELHIKFFASMNETFKDLAMQYTGVRMAKDVGIDVQLLQRQNPRHFEQCFNDFRAKRVRIQGCEIPLFDGAEGLLELKNQSPDSHRFRIRLYWPPGPVKLGSGLGPMYIHRDHLTMCDTMLFSPSSSSQAELKRWGQVENFYRCHVAGDGTFDSSLMPSGIEEFDLKFYAACEQVILPGVKARQAQRTSTDPVHTVLMNSMDTLKFIVVTIEREKNSMDSIITKFRMERLVISGLKNATWLNGAEGLLDNNWYTAEKIANSSEFVYLRLYWPPEAVRRNGGKKVRILKQNASPDYDYLFEFHPEKAKIVLDRAVTACSNFDPICKIFLSLIDFNRISDWYKSATCRRLSEAEDHISTECQRVLLLPRFKIREDAGFVKASEADSSMPKPLAGVAFWSFTDIFLHLRPEIERAILRLNEFDAEACAKSIALALDLIPISKDHIVEKFEFPLWSGPDLSRHLSGMTDQLGRSLDPTYAPYVEKLGTYFASAGPVDFSEKKSKASRVLELFLFLIFQDRHEILRLFSSRQFLVRVYEESGGNFLLQLLRVFVWKCAQELQGKDPTSVDWVSFTTDALHTEILLKLPVVLPVLLHRAVRLHLSRCNCMSGGVWFPCDWPPYVKDYLLSFQFFQNLESNLRLRGLLCHPDVFHELKPRIYNEALESICLIKFACKLCLQDLSTCSSDNSVESSLLQVIEDDLKKEPLGRAILAVDPAAASLIASYFQADELDCIWRYTNIDDHELTSIPVRICGLQERVWMNGAEGTSSLIPDSNGCVLVRIVAPMDVAVACKSAARVNPVNLEILGAEVSATAIADIINIHESIGQNLDTMLIFFIKVGSVMIQRKFGVAKSDSLLQFLVDVLCDWSNNVPFFKTIKQLCCRIFNGIHFYIRVLNPLTRPRALDILHTQLQVLFSFAHVAYMPAANELINMLKNHLDFEAAREVFPVWQEASRALGKFSGASSYEEFIEVAMRHQDSATGLGGSAKLFSSPEEFSSILKEAFPEHSSAINVLTNADKVLRRCSFEERYQSMLQSGMSPSQAKLASWDEVLKEIGITALCNGAEDFNKLHPLAKRLFGPDIKLQDLLNQTLGSSDSFRATIIDSEENSLATDIPDGCVLALEQRVRVKSDYIPAFLAGAEGTVFKLSAESTEIYGVLVKQPAAAVLQCSDGCLHWFDKTHLMILGNRLPRINFATDWIDEHDCVQKKQVSYWSTCPKSHPLHFCEKPVGLDERINFCTICEVNLADQSRFTCSAGCVYSVCQQCRDILQNAASVPLSCSCDDATAFIHVSF